MFLCGDVSTSTCGGKVSPFQDATDLEKSLQSGLGDHPGNPAVLEDEEPARRERGHPLQRFQKRSIPRDDVRRVEGTHRVTNLSHGEIGLRKTF